MKKRAQFYLIAALVIIGIITGLTTVYTSLKISDEDRAVYDLSSEINFEASKVIDNGVLNAANDAEMRANIEALINLYASDSSSREELIVVFGDLEEVRIIVYVFSETGEICISLGGQPVCFDQDERVIQASDEIPNEEGIVNVTLNNGITYEFALQQGQNFFMIIRKQDQDETFVASSQPEEGNVYLEPGEEECIPEEGLIEVCHIEEDSEIPQTIFIGEDSLQIHLNHGDYCGHCV